MIYHYDIEKKLKLAKNTFVLYDCGMTLKLDAATGKWIDDGKAGDQLPPLNLPQSPLSAEEMDRLERMSREELIALVERMARQCGMVACMTDDETAQAMLDMLAETALRPVLHGTSMKADIAARITAIDKWMDRKRGKPIGSAPTVQIGAGGDLNVMIRLVDPAGNVEMIEG